MTWCNLWYLIKFEKPLKFKLSLADLIDFQFIGGHVED